MKKARLGRASSWSRWRDLNSRPLDPQERKTLKCWNLNCSHLFPAWPVYVVQHVENRIEHLGQYPIVSQQRSGSPNLVVALTVALFTRSNPREKLSGWLRSMANRIICFPKSPTRFSDFIKRTNDKELVAIGRKLCEIGTNIDYPIQENT
jgi:hypothetical protein